jgi:murein DD-endopeptidase MepM/ murein hydrolase activator NlpD
MKLLMRKIELSLMLLLITGCSLTVGTGTQTGRETRALTYHYVRKGENLFRISKYYYSVDSVKEIKEGIEKIKQRNNMAGENLSVGQRLVIPGTVKKQPSYSLIPPADSTVEYRKFPDEKAVTEETTPSPIIKDTAFVWPVEGKIICEYGQLGNKGIDILVKPGSEVFAAGSGTIVFVGKTSKYTDTIIIKHREGVYTIYGHDLEISAKQGTSIQKGEIIGRIRSGTQRKRYIHFEMRINEENVNPLIYLPQQ